MERGSCSPPPSGEPSIFCSLIFCFWDDENGFSHRELLSSLFWGWGRDFSCPQRVWCHFSDLTGWNNLGSAPTRWRPRTAEAQLSRSSQSGSWMWRTPSAVEVTRSPACWKRTAKTSSVESACGSVSGSRRPPAKAGGPHPYGWKDIWLTRS